MDNDIIISMYEVILIEIVTENHNTSYVNISFALFLIPSKSNSSHDAICLGAVMSGAHGD